MKRILCLLAVLCPLFLSLGFTAAHAQFFSIEAVPQTTSTRPGGAGIFKLRVTSYNGFKATLYLRCSVLSKLTPAPVPSLSVDRVNSPYPEVMLTVNTAGAALGRHAFLVEGWNGTTITRDTCYLDIDPNSPNGAQPFTVEVTPEIQSAYPDDRTTYMITVRSDIGFNDAVKIQAFHVPVENWRGPGVDLALTELKPPFAASTTIIVKPERRHIGRQGLMIQAWKGAIIVRDTFWLDVLPTSNMRGWTFYTTTNSSLISDYINQIEFDRTGAAWIMTGEGLTQIDGERWTLHPFPEGIAFEYRDGNSAMAIDDANNVWIQTPWGAPRSSALVRFSPDHKWLVLNNARNPDVSVSLTGMDVNAATGDVFVSTGGQYPGRLWMFQAETESYMRSHLDETCPLTSVTDLEFDGKGNLWVIDRNGKQNMIAMYDGQFWSTYVPADLGAPSDMYFSSLQTDRQGNIMVDLWRLGPEYSMIAKYDGTGWSHVKTGLKSMAIDSDGLGNLWCGSNSGLLYVGPDTTISYTVRPIDGPAMLVDDKVTAIRIGPDGRVWVGTEEGGLAIYDPRVANIDDHLSSDPETRMITAVQPHPASGQSSVRLMMPAAGHVRLTLVAALGGEAATLLDGPAEPGERVVSLNTTDLPAGAYFLKLIVDGRTEVRPIIVR